MFQETTKPNTRTEGSNPESQNSEVGACNRCKETEGVPRSYNVSTPTGSELRRNRSHIQPIPQESKGVRFNLQSVAAAAPRREARRESSAIADATPSPSRSPDLETSSTPSDTMISSELANTTTGGGTTSSQHVTRSGRHIKAPARLDL